MLAQCVEIGITDDAMNAVRIILRPHLTRLDNLFLDLDNPASGKIKGG